jgi:hypothetical protein
MNRKRYRDSRGLASTQTLIAFAAILLLSMLINTGSLQAQNDINLLPDTGNVGIGTANPAEKLEVSGNSILDGKVLVKDSLQIDGGVSIEKCVIVNECLSVGSTMRVERSMYIGDTLEIGNTLKVSEIKEVDNISTEKISTNTISGSNGEITLIDPEEPGGLNPNCDALKINYCGRQIYGYQLQTDGSVLNKGVAIGNSVAANGLHSFGAGRNCTAGGLGSIALGTNVRAYSENSIVIGAASSGFLSSEIPNSLMVGFNNTVNVPSLFVGPSTIEHLPGNVGIGTSTPADKLVIGEGYEQISFGSAMNNDAGWAIGYIGMNATRTRTGTWQASTWTISSDGNNAIGGSVIKTEADGKMVFIPINGNNLSGNTMTDAELNDRRMMVLYPGEYDPSSETMGGGVLSVNGKIYCKEIEVRIDQQYWWDDVFAPNYPLRSFEELEAFIALNGHLPDVPTEQEVTENGLSLGESYGTLLRKIEELTLYMLQLKKENEELRKLIENK